MSRKYKILQVARDAHNAGDCDCECISVSVGFNRRDAEYMAEGDELAGEMLKMIAEDEADE